MKIGEEDAGERMASVFRSKGFEVELRKEKVNKFGSELRSQLGISNPAKSTVTANVGAENDGSLGILNETLDETLTETLKISEESDPVVLFDAYMRTIFANKLLQDNTSLPTANIQDTNNTNTVVNSASFESDRISSLHEKVSLEGRSTLERLANSAAISGAGGVSVGGRGVGHNLVVDKLTLSNFGPYGGTPVTYPISNRGLVLLTGKSSDGTGADSNGSGKV